ncbi:triadin isoform X1 [Pitangus sulphuratus]|nr:triadin isoform X1 [Pitangus sulphuratus]
MPQSGHMSTTTTIIDGKNGSVPSSSMKVGKKSVTEDLVTTFSSPAAWLLVVALIVTWSAVAIVMFDLVDYKDLAGRSVNKLSTEPLRIIHETLEESADWIYGFFSLLSDIVWSDDDDESDEAIHRDKPEKQEKIERKEPLKAIHKEKPEKLEKPEKKAPTKVTQKDKPERHEKAEKKPPKEEKKVKSAKVEAKVKKEVKDGKGEKKAAEKVNQAEIKPTETGLIKAKTKVKEEKALQTVSKSDKKDQYAFCRYVIDMFAQGDFYPESESQSDADDIANVILLKKYLPWRKSSGILACVHHRSLSYRAISIHMDEKKIIESSQHVFTKSKSCLTNPIAFYNETTTWGDEGRALIIFYLDFSKAFDTTSDNILIGKLRKSGLDE